MLPRSSRRYETHREHDSVVRRIRRVLMFLLLLFLLYELVTTVLIQSVEQESIAMKPTLEAGDRLFVLPLVYGPRIRLFGWTLPGFRTPERGDLVTVRPGFAREPGFAARLVDPLYRFFTLQNRRADDGTGWDSSLQVKRVVGVPGDTVQIERFVAYIRPAGRQVFVSEFALSNGDYELVRDERPDDWQPLDPFGAAAADVSLGRGEYFLLSDNRSQGIDSRHWGALSEDQILASVSLRFWPFQRIGRP